MFIENFYFEVVSVVLFFSLVVIVILIFLNINSLEEVLQKLGDVSKGLLVLQE